MGEEIEEAKNVVNSLIEKAQIEAFHRFDIALRKIARLSPRMSWRAQQIADEALGIGPYWDRGYRPDTSPKTLVAYYWRLAWYWVFRGRR